MTWLATIVTLLLFRHYSRKFWTNSPKMVSPALKTLHCPSSFTLRSGVGFLLSFLIDAIVVRMCPHNPTWTPLQLFHRLCLFHQNKELSILRGTRNRRNLWFRPPSNFLQRHSLVTACEYNLAKYSNLSV